MLTVRASTYRGKPGWSVSGKPPGKDRTGVRIFTPYRTVALHIRDRLAQGFSINALDFQPRGEG